MKKSTLILIQLIFFLVGCKKEHLRENDYLATVNVVNGITSFDGNEVIVNFTGQRQDYKIFNPQPYHYVDFILNPNKFLGSRLYSVQTERLLPLEVVLSSDVNRVVFQSQMNFKKGSFFTLYLSGDVNSVDTLFVQEFGYPKLSQESTRLRFVNICKTCNTVKIRIKGDSEDLEEFIISYRQISEIKRYQSKEYEILVEEIASGDVIASMKMPANNFTKNTQTIVLRGSKLNTLTDYSPELIVTDQF